MYVRLHLPVLDAEEAGRLSLMWHVSEAGEKIVVNLTSPTQS